MKIGVDFHGVLNADPFFKEMTKIFVQHGHQVHLITGTSWTKKFEKELKDNGIFHFAHYTNFFSVTDALIARGEKVHWEDKDNPWFDKELWNKEKARYCKENNIDIHFDDSKEYGKYFTTPYYLKIKGK
jgi:hypothetical protein